MNSLQDEPHNATIERVYESDGTATDDSFAQPDLSREDILEDWAEIPDSISKNEAIVFHGEKQAIEHLIKSDSLSIDVSSNADITAGESNITRPCLEKDRECVSHHSGLLISQKRHFLKMDFEDLDSVETNLFNPGSVPRGSNPLWLNETLQVGMKQFHLMRDQKSTADYRHAWEVLKGMDFVFGLVEPESHARLNALGVKERLVSIQAEMDSMYTQ